MSDAHSHRKVMQSTGFFSDNQTKQDLRKFIYETNEKDLVNDKILDGMLRDLKRHESSHRTH